MTVGTDGSIMSAGYTNLGDTLRNHVILIRLNPDGTLDQNFGGFVTPQSSADAVGLAVTPGVAVFNTFVVDGGFAEVLRRGASSRTEARSRPATAARPARARPRPSASRPPKAPDIVSFKVKGNALDTNYGQGGQAAVQSEGAGLPSAEDRGRLLVGLPNDRTLHVGYFGGVPAAVVLDANGKLDTSVSGDGIIALPNDTVDRAVLRRRSLARRQAHRALDQQQQGRRPPRHPRVVGPVALRGAAGSTRRRRLRPLPLMVRRGSSGCSVDVHFGEAVALRILTEMGA